MWDFLRDQIESEHFLLVRKPSFLSVENPSFMDIQWINFSPQNYFLDQLSSTTIHSKPNQLNSYKDPAHAMKLQIKNWKPLLGSNQLNETYFRMECKKDKEAKVLPDFFSTPYQVYFLCLPSLLYLLFYV